MSESIVIVGAGAVGGYFGGWLALNGARVTLIDAWPEHVEAIRRDGLKLSGMTPEESHSVQVEALHITEVQDFVRRARIDIAICATKSYDTDWATTMISPYLAPDGYVVSAQNSINEERIAAIVGWGRTVGCVVANNFGVDLYAPGRIRRTMPRDPKVSSLHVGEVHGRPTRRVARLRDIVSAVDGARLTSNLWGERWSKLCVNGMRNGVSAATGLGGNARDSHPVLRRLVIRLAAEAIRVGRAAGYDLETITGFAPDDLVAAADGEAEVLARVEQAMLDACQASARSDLQRPSMAQDIAKRRRTEIHEINGLIVRTGQALGCPTPAHEGVVRVVSGIERGTITPAPETLFEI